MSLKLDPATATLVAALIGVFGALAGVVIERLLRLQGRLRFWVSERRLNLTGVIDDEGYERTPLLEETDETTDADGVRYRATISLFNGREVPIGLHNVRVVFVHRGCRRQTSSPYDSETGKQLSGRLVADELRAINFPPRQFVQKTLDGYFGQEEADALKTRRWMRIEFVAEWPKRPFFGILGSKTYRKTITDPKDYEPRGG